MKKFKKLLTITMIVTMISAFLWGCGAKSQTSESVKTEEEHITLQFYSNEPNLDDKYKEINDEYTKRNPNVSIEVMQIPYADYNTKVDTAILSGQQVDICFFNNQSDYVTRASQNEFIPLNDFIEAEGAGTINDLYSVDPTYEDGKIYGLPGEIKPQVVWINEDDLKKAGLEVPPLDWTWDDYKKYAKAMTWGEGADKHYGSMIQSTDMYDLLTCYNRIEGNPFFKNKVLNLDDPSFKESLQLKYDLEQTEGTSLPLAEQLATSIDFRTAFFENKCSMVLASSSLIPQTADLDNYPHDFKTTYAIPPRPEGGRESVTFSDARFYSIGATSVNAGEAYKYLRYFTTEGIIKKGTAFVSDKANTDGIDQIVDVMTQDKPELFDVDQLKNVLTNGIINFRSDYVPVYNKEIMAAFQAQADKAVIGEISIDDAIKNAKEQCQQIIDSHN
jgi:multiple sugar transport system substrate-binding protein